jgi:hypothetical protein
MFGIHYSICCPDLSYSQWGMLSMFSGQAYYLEMGPEQLNLSEA